MQSLPALGLFGHGGGTFLVTILPSFLLPTQHMHQSQKKAELGRKQQKANEQNSEPYTARESSGPPVMLNFLPSLYSKTPPPSYPPWEIENKNG